jgi:hypothetical protein
MKNLTPESKPNYKVRAMVIGAVRSYGIFGLTEKNARRRANYRLRGIDKNAVVMSVERTRAT